MEVHRRTCVRGVVKAVSYQTPGSQASVDIDVVRHAETGLFYCVGSVNGSPCRYETKNTDLMRVSNYSICSRFTNQ